MGDSARLDAPHADFSDGSGARAHGDAALVRRFLALDGTTVGARARLRANARLPAETGGAAITAAGAHVAFVNAGVQATDAATGDVDPAAGHAAAPFANAGGSDTPAAAPRCAGAVHAAS